MEQENIISRWIHLVSGTELRAGLVPRPHGKVGGLGTLLFQICSTVNEIHLSLRKRRMLFKFEIAMFPDHRFSHGLVTRLTESRVHREAYLLRDCHGTNFWPLLR